MQLSVDGGLQSFVVGAGLLYGHGNLELSDIFKRAWMYPNDALCVPCTERNGTGSNYLPLIHVDDLSVVACQLALRASDTIVASRSISATSTTPSTCSFDE